MYILKIKGGREIGRRFYNWSDAQEWAIIFAASEKKDVVIWRAGLPGQAAYPVWTVFAS